eukprot:scaffold49900_cov63-Phaeocystis_antarctica.AAC.3
MPPTTRHRLPDAHCERVQPVWAVHALGEARHWITIAVVIRPEGHDVVVRIFEAAAPGNVCRILHRDGKAQPIGALVGHVRGEVERSWLLRCQLKPVCSLHLRIAAVVSTPATRVSAGQQCCSREVARLKSLKRLEVPYIMVGAVLERERIAQKYLHRSAGRGCGQSASALACNSRKHPSRNAHRGLRPRRSRQPRPRQARP